MDPQGRVLIVEDEPAILQVFARWIRKCGFEVEEAADGHAATELLQTATFDVVVSDINMPGMDGIELLRTVRERDLDLPVIIVTAAPAVDTAAQAIEYGALRYLTKPVELSVLKEAIEYGVRIYRMGQFKREALAHMGIAGMVGGDKAGMESRFARALEELWLAYQPVISWSTRKIYAFEALLRSNEVSLPTAPVILETARRLDRHRDLGRAVRVRLADDMSRLAGSALVFVNVHPEDLLSDDLYSRAEPLSPFAERVVLEITERMSLEMIPDIRTRAANLRRMGFRFAVDDLGAGYAGLSSVVQLQPEVVKLDMSLVRGIAQEETKQRLVGSIMALCKDMGMLVVAEGVETEEERDTLVSLGCDLLQGYLFAKPTRSPIA